MKFFTLHDMHRAATAVWCLAPRRSWVQIQQPGGAFLCAVCMFNSICPCGFSSGCSSFLPESRQMQ